MTVRAKFRCNYKQTQPGSNYIAFSPVYTGSEENTAFFKATPGGEIRLFTVNDEAAALFDLESEYYVDFSKAGPIPNE